MHGSRIPFLLLCCLVNWNSASANEVAISSSLQGVDAAAFLQIAANLLEKEAVVDPSLSGVKVNVTAECQSWEELVLLVAKASKARVQWASGIPRIHSSSARKRLPAPLFEAKRNHCPERQEFTEQVAKEGIRVRACEPLEFYERDSISLKGFISIGGNYVALAESPDSHTWAVQQDDYIGKDYGKVFKVNRLGVDLREIAQDREGTWQSMSTLLRYPMPNPSIERTCPGKPGHASHLKR